MKIRLMLYLIYGAVIFVLAGLIVRELTANDTSGTSLCAAVILIAGLLVEVVLSETGVINKKEDSGIASALLYGSAVLTIALCRMLFNFMVLDGPARIVCFTAGCACFSIGMLLRFLSRRELGKFFSYALRIEKAHRLISSGIYSTIRHPAYLGAILTLLGVTLMFGAWPGVLIVFVGLIFTLKRIGREEAILQNHFGTGYRDYMMRTNRLIPKIY